MKASQGEAPGKCILFGEHAVVYGYPALAAAIEIGSLCQIASNSHKEISWKFSNYGTSLKWSITDDIPDSPFAHFLHCLKKLAHDFSIEIDHLDITISSHLWSNSGLGSSASSASAFIKALNNYFNLEMTLDQLNEYTLYMERFIHGTPSGLDNSTVNYGGVIHFQKGKVRKLDKFSP
ncbi:MAG: mevalonate kinase family protein, partial [Promethearchaeota archaeon]